MNNIDLKRFVVPALVMLCTVFSFAQPNVSGVFGYDISLGDGESLDVEAICRKNPYASLEAELAACTANRMSSNVLLRTLVGDNINSSIEKKVGDVISRMKTNAAPIIFVEPDSSYSAYYHKLAQNSAFREFLQGRVLDFLRETCRLYPSSYRQLLLSKIDEAMALLSEMQKHHYQIINDKLYKNNILQANGGTLECWIVRRALVDGIPASEMRAFLKAARKLVSETFNPEKPNFVSTYTINEHLRCNIQTNGNSVIFLDKKSKVVIEGVVSIQCLKDASGVYYQIRTARADKSGNRVEDSVLYDITGKPIY